jgi:hypothetical protein
MELTQFTELICHSGVGPAGTARPVVDLTSYPTLCPTAGVNTGLALRGFLPKMQDSNPLGQPPGALALHSDGRHNDSVTRS